MSISLRSVRSDTDQLMTKRPPAAPHLEIGWAFLTANPEAIFAHPTMAEGLGFLLANVPTQSMQPVLSENSIRPGFAL